MVNFFLTFYGNRDFLLYTTVSMDCNSQISSLYVKEAESEILERSESGDVVGNFRMSESGVGVGNTGKVGVGVGVGYFISDSETLVVM